MNHSTGNTFPTHTEATAAVTAATQRIAALQEELAMYKQVVIDLRDLIHKNGVAIPAEIMEGI